MCLCPYVCSFIVTICVCVFICVPVHLSCLFIVIICIYTSLSPKKLLWLLKGKTQSLCCMNLWKQRLHSEIFQGTFRFELGQFFWRGMELQSWSVCLCSTMIYSHSPIFLDWFPNALGGVRFISTCLLTGSTACILFAWCWEGKMKCEGSRGKNTTSSCILCSSTRHSGADKETADLLYLAGLEQAPTYLRKL